MIRSSNPAFGATTGTLARHILQVLLGFTLVASFAAAARKPEKEEGLADLRFRSSHPIRNRRQPPHFESS